MEVWVLAAMPATVWLLVAMHASYSELKTT